MTSNTKEYQRQYQKEYRKTHPQKQYKKVKTEVKKEVKNKTVEERVKLKFNPPLPPRAPKMVEKSVESNVLGSSDKEAFSGSLKNSTDSKTIDPFLWLSSNHSFQMVMYEFIKKFAPGFERIKTRGKKEVLKNSFSSARMELMEELKEVLKKRNEKKET